ncbi:MAG TPA: hypothetical protein DEG96_05605 [Candidatus Atribacteria bacterium]|nr:hypothetical protein [Candidatus Atribacteria bacterium]
MCSKILRIKKAKKSYLLLTICSIFFLILVQTNFANEVEEPPLPKAELPLLITTAGQSPGAVSISVICKRNKIENDFLNLATVEDLNAKEYKTLIITMGTSGKGMGAAGIDINYELDRIEKLIEEARKKNMLILGFHIEGEARRTGHCEESIDLVAPRVDYLIVRSDGNKDGRFTEIAQTYGIPLRIFKESIELHDILKEIFIDKE